MITRAEIESNMIRLRSYVDSLVSAWAKLIATGGDQSEIARLDDIIKILNAAETNTAVLMYYATQANTDLAA